MARKKQFKKKRGRKQSVPRQLSLGPTYPQSIIGRHKYVEAVDLTVNYTLTDSIPAPAFTYFGANTMYDPNREGTGHQVHFFDEMSAIYSNYVVLGSRIKVKFINASLEPMFINLNRRTSVMNTDHTTAEMEETQPTNKMTILPQNTSARPFKVLTSAYSPSKQFGISKRQVRNNSDLIMAPGENVPSNHSEIYYNLAVQQIHSALGGQVDPVVKCFVEIEYTALWSNRKDTTGQS